MTGSSTESTPTRVFDAEGADGRIGASRGHRAQSNQETRAYLLKWTDTEVTRDHIDSAAQLRSRVQDDGKPARHLFAIHGPPADYWPALKEVPDIDASFVGAHAGRRSYRLTRTAKVKASWAHYDYPEPVWQSPSAIGERRHRQVSGDLVGGSRVYAISSTGDGIVFCRTSVWLSEKAHILFLDRAGPASGVFGRQYRACTTEKTPAKTGVCTAVTRVDGASRKTTLIGDGIPDLGTLLCDNLPCCGPAREDILELLEDLALDKWSESFEALDAADMSVGPADTAALFSQMLSCLERNLEVSRRRSPVIGPDAYAHSGTNKVRSTVAEWEALLSRLNRRAQMSGYVSSITANAERREPVAEEIDTAAAAAADGASLGSSKSAGGHYGAHDESRNDDNNSDKCPAGASPAADENRRSVDRVAYLGGILLPFSVVSGILAIEEPFGPGDAQFWIFWAVTVPLVLVTLGVIYADSIRKAEVWVEVSSAASASGEGGSDGSIKSESGLDTRPAGGAPDVEQGLPISSGGITRRFAANRFAQPVTLSLVDDDTSAVDDADADAENGQPRRIVEKRWRTPAAALGDTRPGSHWAGKKTLWRKKELGWMGAFATMFRLYKVRPGVPPESLRRGGGG